MVVPPLTITVSPGRTERAAAAAIARFSSSCVIPRPGRAAWRRAIRAAAAMKALDQPLFFRPIHRDRAGW